jgi:hypothetical protein
MAVMHAANHSRQQVGGWPSTACVLLVCACSPNRYIMPVVTRVANLVLELPEDAAGVEASGLKRLRPEMPEA